MIVDRMLEKAEKLLHQKRVQQIDEDRYNVVGDHGTYTVVRSLDGKVVCNCPGFKKNGRCSHQTAVILLKVKRRRV
ncbi:MAG TPA: hypothetical protein VJ574_01635 [Candidatus Bathyarchaeia archaeon]|nr:hypothetical protein [Candidatus Bathyarchaeia archaeon]